MPIRFRKAMKIAPGVRVTVGKKTASVSAGAKGIRLTQGTTGRRTRTVGVPGSGIRSESTSRAGCLPFALGLVVALIVVACSSPVAAPNDDGPEPAGFDLALVKSNFSNECADPIVVDDLFCQQVDTDDMTADGTILNVPTGLNPASDDRADVICEFFAIAHYDGATGDDLGYDTIGILDMNGGNLAACTVAP